MYVCIGSEYTVSTCTRLHVSDERLPWLSLPLGPGVVAALCRVPAQALVANVREAVPASARPCIVLVTHLAATGRRGVPARGCSGPMGARLSPPIALSGVFPRSWGGGGHGPRRRPGRGRHSHSRGRSRRSRGRGRRSRALQRARHRAAAGAALKTGVVAVRGRDSLLAGVLRCSPLAGW